MTFHVEIAVVIILTHRTEKLCKWCFSFLGEML